MSNPSIEQLLAWMQNKSKTYGWGAIVAYDRRKANDLLYQLYIERFDSGQYLPPIDATLSSDDNSRQFVSGLRLSAPRLSFDVADLTTSRISLTMDFIGGMIVSESALVGISKIQKVLPLNSPNLQMIQPLERVPGQVAGDGVVSFNIANKEGTDYRANFVSEAIDQSRLGDQFRLYFEKQVPDDKKVFYLGTLKGEANDALTPEGFRVWTIAAPGARDRAAPNHGDGAILVFVRMKGRSEGRSPPADFMYPIPADADGVVYTGSVWVSSRTLVHDLVREQAEKIEGIGWAPFEGSEETPSPLVASSGSMKLDQLSVYRRMGIDESASVTATYDFPFADPVGPFSIAVKDGLLDASWKTDISAYYRYKQIRNGWFDQVKEGPMDCWTSAGFAIVPRLDEDGVVQFVSQDHWFDLDCKAYQELRGFTHTNQHSGDPYLTKYLIDRLEPSFNAFLHSFPLVSVDTFMVRNLLFPGMNVMQPTSAHLPGDLALFGHIDPARTSAIIEPLRPVIEAGGSQQFSLGADVTGITWTVRGTDPDDEQIGSISTGGLYKPPAASALPKGFLAVVVTGRGKLDGQDVMSSALVTVLTSTVAVTPIFQVCDAGGSIELSAETLKGDDPQWSLKESALGGKLSQGKGRSSIYTAAPLSSEREPIYIDTVLVGSPGKQAEAQIMVFNRLANINVVISKDSVPESGKVQLQFLRNGIPTNPDVMGVECRLLAGGGKLSAGGFYEQPADATGVAVVTMMFDDGWDLAAGYIAMPLPLKTYAEVNRRVSAAICERALKENPAPPEA